MQKQEKTGWTPWVKPELVRMGSIGGVAATQNTLIQNGNSKS